MAKKNTVEYVAPTVTKNDATERVFRDCMSGFQERPAGRTTPTLPMNEAGMGWAWKPHRPWRDAGDFYKGYLQYRSCASA